MKCSIAYFLTIICILSACRPSKEIDNDEILVKVHGNALYRKEVEKIIPKGIESTDSLLIAENYTEKWIKDILISEVAQRNIGKEEAEINRLVEDYRRSLLKHRYEEYMIKSRLTAEIREDEKRSYYDTNNEKFILEKNLIKGLFLKIPAEATNIADVQKWYKSKDPAELENIEKYSIQNASVYDYFYDRWVDFDEILDRMPLQLSNKEHFLRTNRNVEVRDSTFYYFLNIAEYLLPGNIAPYEYVDVQIQEMMINQRKMDFLNNFEDELYREAVRKGEVLLYINQK
ncbi:MAG: peptidyl-prolyl cis-trans isomerase [Tannerella sp.]|nr:peptidyl-prolyl cis-trans isomerase [Tannerella sp.]